MQSRPNAAPITRRAFLGTSAALAGASLLPGTAFAGDRQAAGDRKLRVALVGCGGRGTGAAAQALSTATGFSMKTCLPRSTQRSKCCGRKPGGVARITTSTSSAIACS